jgi:predicted nuclease with TOPRIM domain
MSEVVKKFSWGYSAMIPYNETAERLGLTAYVRIENYQFIQKMAENLENDNARLKAEVDALRKELAEAQENYHLVNEMVARMLKERNKS